MATWKKIATSDTVQSTTFTIRDDDGDDSVVSHDKFVKFTKGTGVNGVEITGGGTSGDPYVVAISSPDTVYVDADAVAAVNATSSITTTCDSPNIVQTTVSGNAGTVTNGVYTTDAVTVLNGNSGARATTITGTEGTKLGHIGVTQAVDLDTMETATTNNVNRTLDASPTDGNTTNSVSSDGVFDALATKLNLSGGTMTDALTMSSGDKLQFVDGNEYISGDGTDLTIGSGGNVKINPAGGQVIIEDDDVAEPVLEIKSSADASGSGGLKFTKDRGSAGTDGDNIGIINWNAKSSDNTEHLYAQIYGMVTETDAGNEEGRIKLNVSTQSAFFGSASTTGLQLDGTTTNGQVDVTVGAGANSTTAVAGNLTAVGNINGVTPTEMGHLSGVSSSIATGITTANDAMPKAGGAFVGVVTLAANPLVDLGAATKQYVDNKRFAVTTDQLNYRMGTVNYYYVGNQSLGAAVGTGSLAFSRYEAPYAVYTAKNDVKVHSWTVYGSVSSTVSYQYELWDITSAADGGNGNTAADKIGSTQGFNGTASRMYTIGEDGLDYTLSAGHQLYVVKRYITGSGNKYTYATVTVELEVI